jgi:predicted dehydrogenase
MKKIGLGIIGLGYIGNIHCRSSQRLESAELTAVADVSKRALKKAKEMGAKKTYTDYEELLKDPDVDAVIIGLPTHLHLDSAKRAAEAKKHIFLEKPMARTVSEAKEIISQTNRNGVKLMMGYHLRFNDSFRSLKEQINSGVLGDVESAFATFVSSGPFFHRNEDNAPVPVPEWWFNRQFTGGGVLMDMGCHMINLLRFFFGEVVAIRSHLGYRFNMDFEDLALCMARFESGTVAVINVGWFSQEYSLKVELFGSVKHSLVENVPSNPFSTIVQTLATGIPRFYRSHFNELQHFVNCLLEDKSPSSTGLDGLKDMEAISQAYKNKISMDGFTELSN